MQKRKDTLPAHHRIYQVEYSTFAASRASARHHPYNGGEQKRHRVIAGAIPCARPAKN